MVTERDRNEGFSLHQNVFRVLAAVEQLGERQREMIEGAKERDKRLEGLGDNMRDLALQFRDLTHDSKNRQDRTESAIQEIRHDKRNSDMAVDLRLRGIDSHLQELETAHKSTRVQVDELVTTTTKIKKDTDELRLPVTELVGLRNRLIATATFVVSIMGVLWYITRPIVEWLIEHWLPTLFK